MFSPKEIYFYCKRNLIGGTVPAMRNSKPKKEEPRTTTIRLTPQDQQHLEYLRGRHPEMKDNALIRMAVRELAERERSA